MILDKRQLIDQNLKIICESKEKDFPATHFIDEEGDKLTSKHESQRFAGIMENKELITTNGDFCYVTDFGAKVFKDGGWIKHLEDEQLEEIESFEKFKEKEDIEKQLALSNIEANNLNKINSKNNRIATWINVGIGIINLALLLWQILKTKE